ncbi:MAG: formyltetrahydrofolate deformylase [Kiritimatiellae bacterium]|nr:formyltetrahydrofolate deformylase [Kiritimatiellia bacterium]MCO5061541.1 formyltetrahydrofolate deformylase [Kiritimatiellia bacterium]MCO6401164.1 formyltetrahydrofolate deformylase [Verrucomicrobiota bacterium]
MSGNSGENEAPQSAVLLISCPDRSGLVAAVTTFMAERGGNILDLEQHAEESSNSFFMRLEWDLRGFAPSLEDIAREFEPVAERFSMKWELRRRDQLARIALFVTKAPHCLVELLARHQAGEWAADIPLIVSNREDLRGVAERFRIPFHHLPVVAGNKPAQEEAARALMESHRIDLIVFARYMQIVTGGFIRHFPNRIINIHHSFLPAFPGARPYHQAHERGVKVIGATSHYVTEDLDAGPIIVQDVARISHRDSVEDLIRKGRDIEKLVLARAVTAHLEHRVLVYGNRTIVFQ